MSQLFVIMCLCGSVCQSVARLQCCETLCREARIRDVCRMWKSDPWPVHTESLSRPGVARSLPEVRRVQPVPGWDLHLFRPGRQNLLQKRLCKVGVWRYVTRIMSLNHVGSPLYATCLSAVRRFLIIWTLKKSALKKKKKKKNRKTQINRAVWYQVYIKKRKNTYYFQFH